MTRSNTPLPELERELVSAAARQAAAAPQRRRRLHGWTLAAVVLATTGVAGVAAARVAHVGPFAYLERFTQNNPNVAPVSVVTVQPDGPEPAWQAIALVDKLGRLCITGGPRDPRTNPAAPPTKRDLNNPPHTGYTCSDDSDEAAEMLVDPDYPGATFASSSAANGSPNRGILRKNPKTGRVEAAPQQEPTTKLLVYAVAPASLGTVVARWGAKGAPIAMQRSKQHLRMTVDKSPEGLDPDEQAQVARYPDELDLVLWATVVDIPDGVKLPQVAFPAELPAHGVDDATVELLSEQEMSRLIEQGQREGFTYDRGITREPAPVKAASASQRKKISAFARARTAADTVPQAQRPKFFSERSRVQWNDSRKLSVAGNVHADVWIVPGGLSPAENIAGVEGDLTCFTGSSLLRDCKYGSDRWKRPLVEAVTCAKSFAPGETLLWALTPPGATGIELRRDGRTIKQLPAAELLMWREQYDAQPTVLRWTMPGGASPVTVQVPWHRDGISVCGTKYSSLRTDSAGGSSMGGVPGKQPNPPALGAKLTK